jgi:hypothetical protein
LIKQGKEMNINSVIFVVISGLFVATIYSSSTSVVFAAVVCVDGVGTDKPTKFCITDSSPDNYKCVQQDDGKWKCEVIKSANVPPGLTDALNDATGSKAPLNDRGVLEDPTQQGIGPNEGIPGNLQGNNAFSELNSSDDD